MQAALGVRPAVLWGPAWQKPHTADVRVSAMHVPEGTTPMSRPAATPADPSPLAIIQHPLNAQHPIDARIQTAPIEPLYPVNRVVNRPIFRGPPTTQPSNQSLSDQFPPQPSPLEIPTTQPVGK
jgi:hypothetical protein